MPELFGTNGVRGIANEDLTPQLVLDLTRSLSTYIEEGPIAIARDTRETGDMLKRAAVSGIQSVGLDVVDLGVVPSPNLQYYVKESEAKSGVIITASHNPSEYNGVKMVDSDGVEYNKSELEEMEEIYFDGKYDKASWDCPGRVRETNPIYDYIREIRDLINEELISEKKFKVVVDPGNGAGCYVTPYLLREIGCKVITLNSQPDGNFPAREPEPLPENLGDLAETVRAVGADLGIAHDGDADRATFVDNRGNSHMGDDSLALLFKKMLKDREGDKVVTPVSSGNKVVDAIRDEGGEVIWTKVGSTVVAHKMIELGEDCACGGEENGGVIFPDFQYCRDGLLAASRLIELLAEKEKSFYELTDELSDYKSVKTKIKVENKKEVMKKVLDKVEKMEVDANYIDGAKIFYEDKWLLIRPSGTEPVIRVFTEAKKEKEAKKLAEEGLSLIEETMED
ncbi:MAG: Phosphomannomutase [Candidatus Methanohalarchaeum thermophilum]|uniref:Phosphomannomutase n=1 Tax=Methanohalarchaeum thermophilum TaxID=1903181 RepID=A0A1Q6DU64_METT1|nr:MAG: Phosphomannomutase [Candidatus Methanohalarchaeum thermophilum]